MIFEIYLIFLKIIIIISELQRNKESFKCQAYETKRNYVQAIYIVASMSMGATGRQVVILVSQILMNSNSSQHTEISRYLKLLVNLDSGSVDLLSQSEPFVLYICTDLLSSCTAFILCTLIDLLYLLEVLSQLMYIIYPFYTP